MEIKIYSNKERAAFEIALMMADQIVHKPNSVLGLATGNTMISVYRHFVDLCKKRKINLSKIRTFNLDEYYSNSGKRELYEFMNEHFFIPLNLKKEQINFLEPSRDWKSECERYENEIKNVGGIDFQLLGVGINGHIGFNEPGSKKSTKTRLVKLSNATKKKNKIAYDLALTMGISTILKSKKIITVAFGKDKSEIVYQFMSGKKSIPVSQVISHKQAIFVFDLDAMSLVRERQIVSGAKMFKYLSVVQQK